MRIPVLTLAAFAGIAQAAPVIHQVASSQQEVAPFGGAAFVVVTATFSIGGLGVYDEQGDLDNVVLNEFLYANTQVVGAGFDVSLTTINGSWLSEPTIALESSDQSEGLFMNPGAGFDTDGVAQSYNSGGMMDLGSMPVPLDFALGADGILRIELFDAFDDNFDSLDAVFGSESSVFVQYLVPVPTPGAMALLGLAGLAGTRRRR